MNEILLKEVYKHVKRQPDKLCIVSVGHEITYSQFWIGICLGARKLKEAGIQKQDRVCLCGEQSVTFLMMVSAVHLLGATAIPLEKKVPVKRIQEIMTRMDTSWAAGRHSQVEPIDSAFFYEDFESIFYQKTYPFQVSDDIFESLPPEEFESLDGNLIQDILFTTGTTGEPKGIMLSCKAAYAVTENVIDSVSQTEDDFEVLTNPVNHGGGLRRYYSALFCGGTVGISAGSVFQEEFFELMERYPVNAVFFVPAQLSVLLRYKADELGNYVNRLRYIELGTTMISEPETKQLARLLPKTEIYNVYGASEAGCACAVDLQKHGIDPSCIGRPTCNTTFTFADEAGHLFDADAGHPGTIVMGGPILMDGYWKDPEKSSEVLKDGKFYTEDIGYRGADGYLYFLGRKSDVIVCGGNKIAPFEIEDCIMGSGMIKECACVPRIDKLAGQVPELYVVMNDGIPFQKEKLLQYLQEHLEFFKVPKSVIQIDKLPRTANGKVIKKELIGR